MKATLYFTLTLLTLGTLALVPNSFAQERPIVKIIYFYPNDRSPQTDIDKKLVSQVKKAQKLFADLMEAHGFDRKTFQLEEDAKGDVIVHHRRGSRSDAYYRNDVFALWYEFPEESDLSKDFYIVFFETDTERSDLPPLCGLGFNATDYKGGLLPSSGECFEGVFGVNVIAHELAHGFELAHDDRSNADAQRIYLDSIDTMITTYCAAAWFDGHPVFNTGTTLLNQNMTARMLEPELASPPYNIRLRFEIGDPDGIYMVKLLSPTSDGDLKLRGCKVLNGASDITVEFVTNELPFYTDTIVLRMRDVLGNYRQREFKLSEPLPFPPPEDVHIPDPNLAAALQKQIGTITTHTIVNLTELNVQKKKIKNLTGLEHAQNLTKLTLFHNDISDVSPLSKLIRLRWLYLGHNPISDVSPLSALTGLRLLDIGFTDISDISPLKDLKHLEFLGIHGTGISDVPPLTAFKKLRTLYLHNNAISDIASLSALTQLNVLFLSSNTVSDISSLTKLTKLTGLYLGNNAISDISPLANLTQLKVLVLVNNRISDAEPLANLVNLKKLSLYGNPIKNRKPLLKLLRKNPDMKIYLEDEKNPLPVTLSHFRAEHTDTGVILNWTTESEVDNAGFYIYRSETRDGEFKVANPSMIQGAGTTSERNTYTWTDTTAKSNTAYYYRIEDVSHAGVRKQLATVRMRGLISASGKLTTLWVEIKNEN